MPLAGLLPERRPATSKGRLVDTKIRDFGLCGEKQRWTGKSIHKPMERFN